MSPPSTSSRNLADDLNHREVVVCLGPGGVGKTTSAAALGVALAQSGRKVCVVTFDPARRLASALGLDHLDNEPMEIQLDPSSTGTLYACMLNAKQTFDDMVHKYATSEDQAQLILANRVYRNLTTNLSGTHEYMAMERLFELHQDTRFDLVIVDTPPSLGALDILDAPRRLVSFLENRVFSLLVKPGPVYLKPVTLATRTLLKAISRVVGSEVVSDAVDFFQAFSGLEEGFKSRARAVEALLSSTTSTFLLVTAARTDTLAELSIVAHRLLESGHTPCAAIINKRTPNFGSPPPAPTTPASATQLRLRANFDELASLRSKEEDAIANAFGKEWAIPKISVDAAPGEITTQGELARIGERLLHSPYELSD